MSEDVNDIDDEMMVGSWRLTEWLAQGGMGEVYVAEHELMGREAVVKLLHSKLLNDEDVVRRFLNEARASAAIRHPGIVEIFDLGSSNGKVYIVMERLYGETLADRIARAPLILGLVMTLTKQLVGALAAAHKHDIVHRDLKPENLFVVDDPDVPGGKRIKILDFGVAKLAPEQGGAGMTAQGMVFGTPAYMAPEQCQNSAKVDHRADLYAVGCIMYEMLGSEPPFGHGGLELFAAHLRDMPPPLSERGAEVPKDVENIVFRLLAKDPDARFQNCDELLEALENAKITARRRAQGKQRRRRQDLAFAETVPPYVVAEETAKIAKIRPEDIPDGIAKAAERNSEEARNREARPRVEDEQTGDKKSRKGTASPTTHRHATGQVIDVEAEVIEATPEGRKSTRWAAAAVLAAILAGGAFMLVKDQLRDEPESAARPEPAPAPAPAPLPPPPPPVPEKPSGEEFLADGQRALQALDFYEAGIAARRALEVAPEGSEIHEAATLLDKQARDGVKFQWAFDSFNKAAADKDLRTAVYAYEQLPEDGVFRKRAGDKYLAMRDEWLKPQQSRVATLISKKKCGKIGDVADDVRLLFPESAAPMEEAASECYAKRDRRRNARKPKPPEPPPVDITLLPKTVPKIMIRQRLAGHKRRMKACLIENPLEITSTEKTVPVVATLRIEPNGKLSKFEISPRTQALSTCLFFELRAEEFPQAREATTMKYPVGKGRIKNVTKAKAKKPDAKGEKASSTPKAEEPGNKSGDQENVKEGAAPKPGNEPA